MLADTIKLIDDSEVEEEIVQDGMNNDNPLYNNSPDRETHGGNWPLDGDMDNNQVANKDALVNRNTVNVAEQLMTEYRLFLTKGQND